VGTDAIRRLSDEITLQQTLGGDSAADYDGWEAGLVDLSRDRVLARLKQGRGTFYREGVRRDHVIAAVTDLRAKLDQFRMAADRDLAALLQQELRGPLHHYQALKSARGALDFLDLLLVARNLVRDNRQVREGISGDSSGSSSTSSRTPIRCRRRSSCCCRATTRRDDWRTRDRCPGGCFSSAIRTVDLSLPPRRRRHLPRGMPARRSTGRDAPALSTSFRSVPALRHS
jgi:hypothetical protein